MDSLLFYSLFFSLCTVYIAVAWTISRSVKNLQDYFLAGRHLGIFQLTVSLIATQLGGGYILGISKESFTLGYFGLFYVIGMTAGLLILAGGIAAKLRGFNVVTTAQLFQTHYDSVFLRRVASVLSIFSLIGLFSAQIIGSRSLLNSLGVYNPFFFVIFWILIITYAMLGGLKAIVQNDIFQLSIIILVFLGLFLVDLFSGVSQATSVFTGHMDLFTPIKDVPWSTLLVVPLMPALYSLIEQDLAQVFFAAQKERLAIRAAWIAGLFLMLFALIPVYFGMKARIMGISLQSTCNPLITLFDNQYNCFFVMLVTYGVIAAIISTANGLLCAITANIVQDFELERLSKKHQLVISRSTMFVVGAIGIIFASYFDNIIAVIVESYAIPVTALCVPLLCVYYVKKESLSTLGAYISIFAGLGVFGSLLAAKSYLLLTPEIDGLIASMLGYAIGYLIENRHKKPN